MAITNKLITFNKLTSFETQLAQGNILETSIVFIKDAKKIWTKGTYFDCSGGGDSIPLISGLVITSSGTLNEEQLAVLNNRPTVFIAQISQPFRGFALFGRIPVGEGDSDGAFAANIEKDYFVFNYFENNTYSLTQTELALKSDIGYTTEFSVADIEAVYGRGITKPINVQGLMSAIEANKPIIIPTNITDASQVGGNAVTMAKMENDGFIYLNVIVPYLDGVHKEYFIQIKITTAQLIKSGSNGSITLKELVAKTDLKTINGESILGEGNIVVNVDTSNLATKEELESLTNEVITNEEVVAAAFNDVNERINAISENVSGTTVTKEELESTVETINQTISDNKSATDTAIEGLETSIGNVDAKFANYATTESLTTEITNLTNEIIANEEVHAAALNDLNERLNNGGGSSGGSGIVTFYITVEELSSEYKAKNAVAYASFLALKGECTTILKSLDVPDTIMTMPCLTFGAEERLVLITFSTDLMDFAGGFTKQTYFALPDGSVTLQQ